MDVNEPRTGTARPRTVSNKPYAIQQKRFICYNVLGLETQMRIREIPAGDNISVKGDGRTIAGFSAGYPNLLRSTLSWKSTSGIQ